MPDGGPLSCSAHACCGVQVFKEILQADGRGEGHELIRTLSGRQVRPPLGCLELAAAWAPGAHKARQRRSTTMWTTAPPQTSTCGRLPSMSLPTSPTYARS